MVGGVLGRRAQERGWIGRGRERMPEDEVNSVCWDG